MFGWIVTGVVIFVLVLFLRFQNRPRVPVTEAVVMVEAFGDELQREVRASLERNGVTSSAKSHNETMAFIFAVLGTGIQKGQGSHRLKQAACAELDQRYFLKLVELSPYDGRQLIETRYREYASRLEMPGQNATSQAALASMWFGAQLHRGLADNALVQVTEAQIAKATFAWNKAVAMSRLT